jgi:acetylornithine deacetylase/succinyl-diaminopimelate desuccinylase-like protein
MRDFTQIDTYLESHLSESIEELKRLVSQPSVSAQNYGLEECAELVAEIFKKRGFSVKMHPTRGAPIITAEYKGASSKTLLFYDHYDVQPPEPLDLWESPPFEPCIRDGKLYGRGASDNKGNITNRLFAIDSLLTVLADLPCTVKFLVEGEEETSSENLEAFVEGNINLLRADACIWEFGGVDHRERPMQYLGLRGICYVELEVETASTDVHSGLGGSIFPNAAWRLVWALNSLKGPNEKIQLPGFYDKVKLPSEQDRDYMCELPDMAKEYKRRFGVGSFLNGIEGGVELNIAEVFQPTCTVCGLTSGYQGAGSKTVLPSKASAKVDFRLVPDQRPEDVLSQLRSHLDNKGFDDIKVKYLGGEPPARTDPNDPFVQLVVNSTKDIYGVPMQIVPMVGGSGPNYIVKKNLNVPIVTVGIGYPDSHAHAPNENIRLDLYLKTAKQITRILCEFVS